MFFISIVYLLIFYLLKAYKILLTTKNYKMKKLLPTLSILLLFAACKSKSATDQQMVGTSGTGISGNSSILTDTSRSTKTTRLANGTTTTTTTTTTKPVGLREPATTVRSTNKNTSTSTSTTSSSPTDNTNTTTNTTTTSTKKKGWSDAAVDATAGGLGGAVIGAAVSKNKVEGALIGGAVGAGGGYIIGRASDRKSGRVVKKRRVTTTTTNN